MKVKQEIIFVYMYSIYIYICVYKHAGCQCHRAKVYCINFTTKNKKESTFKYMDSEVSSLKV
jgi:hypothetical protein